MIQAKVFEDSSLHILNRLKRSQNGLIAWWPPGMYLKFEFRILIFQLFKDFAIIVVQLLSCTDNMDYSPPGSSCPWNYPGKNTGVGCHFLLQGNLPDPGIKPTSPASPALTGRFFTTEPPEKPTQNSYLSNVYSLQILVLVLYCNLLHIMKRINHNI